jgi:hypothetical protein
MSFRAGCSFRIDSAQKFKTDLNFPAMIYAFVLLLPQLDG